MHTKRNCYIATEVRSAERTICTHLTFYILYYVFKWCFPYRHLAAFVCEELPYIIESCQCTLPRRDKESHELLSILSFKQQFHFTFWMLPLIKLNVLLPDFKPLFIVWPKELKGFVDLHTFTSVLPNVKLCRCKTPRQTNFWMSKTSGITSHGQNLKSQICIWPFVGTSIQLR